MHLRPRVAGVAAIATNTNESCLEADSHADTTCLGRGALKILDFNTPVNVTGYDLSLGTREYSTITRGLVYVQPYTGKWYHLIVHQAIQMPELQKMHANKLHAGIIPCRNELHAKILACKNNGMQN